MKPETLRLFLAFLRDMECVLEPDQPLLSVRNDILSRLPKGLWVDRKRYKALMLDDNNTLRGDEINYGWHFCSQFDGLLVGPGMSELHACCCFPTNHPVYQTIAPDTTQEAF